MLGSSHGNVTILGLTPHSLFLMFLEPTLDNLSIPVPVLGWIDYTFAILLRVACWAGLCIMRLLLMMIVPRS